MQLTASRLPGRPCCVYICKHQRCALAEEHAAYGIGRTGHVSPSRELWSNLGLPQSNLNRKAASKEKMCFGRSVSEAWRIKRREYADEPSSHRAHAEEFYL